MLNQNNQKNQRNLFISITKNYKFMSIVNLYAYISNSNRSILFFHYNNPNYLIDID